jgi:phage replication initiation protein
MTQRTIVDWFAGRTRSPIDVVPDALRPFFGFEGQYLDLALRGRGWLGYESSADIRVLGANVGIAAWGGTHQKGWTHVSLSGSGCAWVQDWDRAQDSLQSLSGWENRRVDIALDTFARESSHESVLAAYRSGGFTTSGRPPKLQQIIGEDPADGRTIYIGKREGDKFLRCYEKGRQLAAGQPGLTHIDGVPVADWYRVEAELKVKDRPLPGDIIDRRDQYLAGCYPYLAGLLSEVEPEILVNLRERVPQLDLSAALENIRCQYGRTIFTALAAYGGDIGAVMAKISAREHNLDLVRAGVLTVEHV